MPRSARGYDPLAAKHLAGRGKAFVAISMAWAAGYVDVVGWLFVHHIYSSHMTGNTATFARDLSSQSWGEAIHHGWVILPFVAGLLYSAATTKAARRHGFDSSFSIALFTELFILLLFLILGSRNQVDGKLMTHGGATEYLLLSLPAAAMGIQTVTVTNINGLRVYTTYLTGSLSKLSEAIVDYSFWFYDRISHQFPSRVRRVLMVSPRQKSFQHAALTAGLWVGFFTGAFCGAVTAERFAFFSLLAPMAVLTAAAAVDIVRPAAAADEPEAPDSAH